MHMADRTRGRSRRVERRRSTLPQISVRIVKPLPAPAMDGFDMRGLACGRIHSVDMRLARYLVFAGYAEPADLWRFR